MDKNAKKTIIDIICTVVMFISIVLLILTFSISLPIYFRPFYYIQINLLDIPNTSGYSYEVIKAAFDEVMDFLCFNKEFGTGELLYSESGKDHFIDCKVLFDLNAYVFIFSFITTLIIFILQKKSIINLRKPFGFNISFYSSCTTILLPLIVGALATSDFDAAFTIFHKIFFPGKDNWYFNPYLDEIINILPQEFFANAALLIGISLLSITVSIIVVEVINRRKSKKSAFTN